MTVYHKNIRMIGFNKIKYQLQKTGNTNVNIFRIVIINEEERCSFALPL